MNTEKRGRARGNVQIFDRNVRFFLRCEDGVYAVTRVRNVSLSGVGIETRYRLKPGEGIVLKYRSRETKVSVNGTVTWCCPNGSHSYTLGVAFDPKEREKNSVFFLALRKYLDRFDGVSADG
jgi:Tfp pilus assembly protein PilZ